MKKWTPILRLTPVQAAPYAKLLLRLNAITNTLLTCQKPRSLLEIASYAKRLLRQEKGPKGGVHPVFSRSGPISIFISIPEESSIRRLCKVQGVSMTYSSVKIQYNTINKNSFSTPFALALWFYLYVIFRLITTIDQASNSSLSLVYHDYGAINTQGSYCFLGVCGGSPGCKLRSRAWGSEQSCRRHPLCNNLSQQLAEYRLQTHLVVGWKISIIKSWAY